MPKSNAQEKSARTRKLARDRHLRYRLKRNERAKRAEQREEIPLNDNENEPDWEKISKKQLQVALVGQQKTIASLRDELARH